MEFLFWLVFVALVGLAVGAPLYYRIAPNQEAIRHRRLSTERHILR